MNCQEFCSRLHRNRQKITAYPQTCVIRALVKRFEICYKYIEYAKVGFRWISSVNQLGARGELIKIEPRARCTLNKGELRYGKGEENVGGRVDGA